MHAACMRGIHYNGQHITSRAACLSKHIGECPSSVNAETKLSSHESAMLQSRSRPIAVQSSNFSEFWQGSVHVPLRTFTVHDVMDGTHRSNKTHSAWLPVTSPFVLCGCSLTTRCSRGSASLQEALNSQSQHWKLPTNLPLCGQGQFMHVNMLQCLQLIGCQPDRFKWAAAI